jgi:hypothetical protein
MQKKGNEVYALGVSVGAALKGYEAVVKEIAATDKSIENDFKQHHFDAFVDAKAKQYKS